MELGITLNSMQALAVLKLANTYVQNQKSERAWDEQFSEKINI